MRFHLSIVAALLAPSLAAAQATSQVATKAATATVLTPARLQAIGDSLPSGASRTAQLGKGSGYTYALTQREKDGGVELHEHWTDVFVIQRGTATLVTGPGADGARETSRGEWRGGSIREPERRALQAGDVVIIPAGVAHQMQVPSGRMSYLAFKIAVPPDDGR